MVQSWTTYTYRVELLRIATPAVLEVCLAPVGPVLPYRAGQYVQLGSPQLDVPERAYSIANAPRPDGRLSLLVTRHPDGATSGWVHGRLRVGDDVTLTGPFGSLMVDPSLSGPVLLLAAGCGVAPVGAIAEALVTSQPDRPVTLCFSGRTSAHLVHRSRFERLARHHDQFEYVWTLTRDHTASRHHRVPVILGDLVDDLADVEVFIAGSEGFVLACEGAVLALGAQPAAVHTEAFLADPMPWTVREPVSLPGPRR